MHTLRTRYQWENIHSNVFIKTNTQNFSYLKHPTSALPTCFLLSYSKARYLQLSSVIVEVRAGVCGIRTYLKVPQSLGGGSAFTHSCFYSFLLSSFLLTSAARSVYYTEANCKPILLRLQLLRAQAPSQRLVNIPSLHHSP